MVGTLDERAALEAEKLDEDWVRTSCILCLNRCGILAHRTEDGYVDKIVGDPENPHNEGKSCAKGNSGMEGIAPEIRITTPLRRTNPEKGIGVDPGFEPISWEEALDEVARHLKEVHEEDPTRLLIFIFDAFHLRGSFLPSFATGFGAEFSSGGAAFFCGNSVHPIHTLAQNAFEGTPDPHYSEYILHFGSQYGSVVHYDTMKSTRNLAGKRPGKLKQVVVDPVCAAAASRAEEWVPIRPGTDAALILGMVNLMINENDHYDKPFLRSSTNGPYLIGEDELYVRDAETDKPLVWDAASNSAKPFDADVGEYALEGHYEVNGKRVKTAFQALKEHVARYTPEFVEEVTTVPRETVRRLAWEYGEAAHIGETIEIDGVELPFRPASVTWYRGLSAHKHAFLAGLSINLLPTLIGGLDVPGGLLGEPYASGGRGNSGRKYNVDASPDGLLIPSRGAKGSVVGGGMISSPYPPRKVRPPLTPQMFELIPVGWAGAPFYLLTSEKEDVYKPPPFPKMLIQHQSNIMKTSGPPDIVERFLKRIPFITSIARRMEETTEFADIVLPDLHHLERLVPFVYNNIGSGEGCITNYGAKPVVHPPFEHPFEGEYVDVMQIFLELARRAGFLEDFYEAFNLIAGLKDENRLDLDREYTYPEIVDRFLKNELGPDNGLEWFMEDGLWTEDKAVEDKYPRPFVTPRCHIYYEFMKRAGEDVQHVTEELGIPWDTQDYQVLPDWKPGPSYKRQPPHDLIVINTKVPNHALSHTHRNPLLQSLSARHNDLRTVWINTRTAAERGIADGDWFVIETFEGRQQRAIANVTELVHPEVLATQGCGGGWMDPATNQEVNFNALLAIDEDHIDFVTGALDSAVPARAFKAE